MLRLNAISLIPCAAVLLASFPADAALDFHTYRIQKNVTRVLKDGKYSDSTSISYELTRLGSSSLEASSLTLTSHGSYLSVVEEATLTGNTEERPHDITKDFMLQGSLPIPRLAAVHSLSAEHGDTLYQATLKKQVYSLDDQFFDTLMLKNTLDTRVAFLQQLTDVSYEASFTKLSLGEPVRVRIEYDLPFPGAPGTAITVPILFHPSGTPPRQAQITFFEKAEGLPAVQWLSESGRVSLEDKSTHTVGYQGEYSFRRDEDKKTIASLQTTAIAAGKLKGEYLLIKAGLNDSLMDGLSRPLEVGFLWRWNQPFNFVELQNGLKTLSSQGLLVAAEARALREIILEMAPHGHRFGLLHSVAGKPDTLFPAGAVGNDEYRKLLDYLGGFTESRLYADYKDYKNDKPDWAATIQKDTGEVEKSRNEFLADLKTIKGGFSTREGVLKHIELVGIGSAPATVVDLRDPKAVEAVLDSVTFAHALVSWLGVDLDAVMDYKANRELRALEIKSPLAIGLPPLLFPVYQPTSVEYRAFTASRSHAVVMAFSASAEREAMIKGATAFADTLQLQGIDVLGRKTRILSLKPRAQAVPNDSGLARLWAADVDRIAEASEVDIGMRYGILTKGTYLAAGVGEGIAHLPDGGVAVLPKSVRVAAGRTFRLEGGMLRLDASQRIGAHARLQLYDLAGRLMGSLELDAFRVGDGFAIPLDRFARYGTSRLVIVLRGAGRVQPFTLVLGGHS